MSQERVIVVGAGLAGLATAVRLSRAGRQVTVLEGASRAGGQIQTEREPGLTVELGAEGFVARSRAVPALCRLVGLESALVEQLTTDTYCLEGEQLVLLPPGEAARRLGFQVPEEELGRGIRSLSLGMGELTDALAVALGPERLRLGQAVTAVERLAQGFCVGLASGQSEVCGRVVIATPARAAAQLLESLGLEAVAPLLEAPVMSNVSVNLLYRRAQLGNAPRGSGLLFPDSFARVGLRALSFVDHKFARRAPADCALLRLFFRPVAGALEAWDDPRFAAEASSAVAQLLAVTAPPERSWVSRWASALPVFSVAYQARAQAADGALQALGVHLAGSAFHGAGVDAAVASAEAVAARLLAS
jgi:oxygen-dependent protoporphyrinogen oxidase